MSVNKVILVGHVGKDPDVKTFENGGKIATFSLATNEQYNNAKGELVKVTDWHNVVARGKSVDVIEKYVKKGDLLYVEGKIKQRSYDNKDGQKIYITEVVSESFKFLSGKREESATAAPSESAKHETASSKPWEKQAASKPQAGNAPFSEEDLPY